MASAFAWIGELAQWFADWLPRWEIVQTNEAGVRYVRGLPATEVEPGFWWYWPITTSIETHHTCRQVLEVATQTLTTDDGVPVIVGGVLVYRIVDVLKYEVENLDADDSLDQVVQAAIRRVVISKDFDVLQKTTVEADKALRREAQKLTEAYGIEVEECRLTDFARCRVISLLGFENSLQIGG
jgi:regulator of protease activity HflC (stomatin/prohibitin superfamily)